MDCLPRSTRSPLFRRNVRAVCSRCYFSLTGVLPPRKPLVRQYAFAPTRRSMTAHGQNAAQDNEDSSNGPDKSQTHSLSGYYADILNTRSPYRKHAIISRPVQPPEETPTDTETEPQSNQDKMSIVFGTRLASPGYRSTRYNPATTSPESTWKTVNGVAIPPRPEEPDNCCMSGCVHCVWDDFRDDLEQWAERIERAKAKSISTSQPSDMLHGPRPEVDSASTSMDDDGGGSETNWPLPDQTEDLFASIPVGIREFMKTEKRLRQKHQQEEARA